jgi:hypothetical protein
VPARDQFSGWDAIGYFFFAHISIRRLVRFRDAAIPARPAQLVVRVSTIRTIPLAFGSEEYRSCGTTGQCRAI